MDKSDFKLTKISTIMLGVRDLARAVAFYRDKLGLTIQFEIPGFAFLNAGGVTELVFAVDDVEGAYDILSARGVKFTHKPRPVTEAQWAANFEDRDGHKLSVFGPHIKT